MGQLRQSWIKFASHFSWRRQGRHGKMLAQFSQAERGSCYDMLAAAELTERRDLRKKYLEHALDEARHARLFKKRAIECGVSRENAAMMDIGYITENGIVGGQTLFERLGEMDFLAFVHVAESRALEQFDVYMDNKLGDPKTLSMLKVIAKDEIFHKTYSVASLDFYKSKGQEAAVKKAFSKLKWNRLKEGWLRFGQRLGSFMGRFWMIILYIIVIAPFRLLARHEKTGWAPRKMKPSLKHARAQF